jgi:hypothetical protein
MRNLTTPRKLIDYLCIRLGELTDGPPLKQRAFYKIRTALSEEIGVGRKLIEPGTRLADLAVTRDSREIWAAVGARLDVNTKDFIRPTIVDWFRDPSHDSRSIGLMAEDLALHRPAALKRGDGGWTRAQVTETVYCVLDSVIMFDARPAGLDADFIRDLGMG